MIDAVVLLSAYTCSLLITSVSSQFQPSYFPGRIVQPGSTITFSTPANTVTLAAPVQAVQTQPVANTPVGTYNVYRQPLVSGAALTSGGGTASPIFASQPGQTVYISDVFRSCQAVRRARALPLLFRTFAMNECSKLRRICMIDNVACVRQAQRLVASYITYNRLWSRYAQIKLHHSIIQRGAEINVASQWTKQHSYIDCIAMRCAAIRCNILCRGHSHFRIFFVFAHLVRFLCPTKIFVFHQSLARTIGSNNVKSSPICRKHCQWKFSW